MAFIPDEAIDRMNDLTPGAWRLFCFLCRCRNQETGRAFPSAQTCSEAISTHQKNIFRLRKELADNKFCSFEGNETIFHFSFKSSKNATTDKETKRLTSASGDSSKNATPSSKNATELQICYPIVAKTLPDSSKFATAYKEQPKKEPEKEPGGNPPDFFDEVRSLIIAATGTPLVNGNALKIERAAVTITQAAGKTAPDDLKAYIAFQGSKAIRLEFIASEFCAWNAGRKRTAIEKPKPAYTGKTLATMTEEERARFRN